VAAVPVGTDSHTKTIFWWVPKINSCSVRGSRLKLLEVGWRTGVSGIVVQMYTALITTLKRDRTFRRIRVRSPRGPPRANCALSSSPHTK
jgi:hypothetical protein